MFTDDKRLSLDEKNFEQTEINCKPINETVFVLLPFFFSSSSLVTYI